MTWPPHFQIGSYATVILSTYTWYLVKVLSVYKECMLTPASIYYLGMYMADMSIKSSHLHSEKQHGDLDSQDFSNASQQNFRRVYQLSVHHK